MKLITIQWASINIPNQKYVILSDGEKSAIYRKYLYIFYIRVSKVYKQWHDLEDLLKIYNKLNLK